MSITETSASTQAVHRGYEPYRVHVEDYISFHKQGFLLMLGLVPRESVQELIDHMDNLLTGRETIPAIAVPSHYCNARSWIPWNRGAPYEGESANYLHIVARGTTHLPHVESHPGTPCVANRPRTPVSRSCGGKPM